MTDGSVDNSTPRFADAALARAQGDYIATSVVNDVVSVCRPDEVVLEVAQCTHPGFESACVATNRHLFLGVGPGQLDVVDLDLVTSVSALDDDTLPSAHSVEVRAMAAPLVWHGFGPRGVARIVHAVEWVLGVHRQHRSNDHRVPMPQVYQFWRDTYGLAQTSNLSGDAFDHYVDHTMSRVWSRQ
ncbi:hypothetical protein [Corynebacterium cystitidis]|uniref:hypothetical protein n=1 Tax=Corynebacterium cystitidis TaxID=35757 RepID=UPI00211E9AE7|nr:hypothetical protein [Corynebacterium cystitidis]